MPTRSDVATGWAICWELRPALVKYIRRGLEAGRFFFVTDLQSPHEFPRHDVFQLREQDIHQEIYGLPPYLGALQSAMLNESASCSAVATTTTAATPASSST
ncbi:hypothetical protein [Acidovorax sp. LjRoot117]|uniref:hypothetical protein n=1 Tax=Acidovorax sp. LjRoot117 TaxID=3342255 RepID=UPI003ECC1A82